jgi:hypothetical protein
MELGVSSPGAEVVRNVAPGGKIHRSSASAINGGQPLPDALRAGVERLSRLAMGDVRVHYASPQPARIGALAYAEGSDIHLAPGQAEHLAHEAWHVVQQKRDALSPTLRLKGWAVNLDGAAEAEADRMGAAAARCAGEADDVPLTHRRARRAVVQPRMPEMTIAEIKANPQVAQELLLHRVRTISNDEYTTMRKKNLQLEAPEKLVAELQKGKLPLDTLLTKYPLWYEASSAQSRFVPEAGSPSEPTVEQSKAIVAGMSVIGKGIQTTGKNAKALTQIFGVKEDELSPVTDVLVKASGLLRKHYTAKTCPVLVLGNQVHNVFVGVAGMTKEKAERVDLGSGMTAQLAAGSLEGQAALVHELTHAAAGTKDWAYGLADMAKLGPKRRKENASHFEHAYLETMGAADKRRYYDPVVSIGQKQEGLSEEGAMRKKKVLAATNLLAEMWNTLDNCYLAAQRLREQPGRNETAIQVDEKLRMLGVLPYGTKGKKLSDDAAMALIEDRTRYLHTLKDVETLRLKILKIKGDELKTLEPQEFVSSIVAQDLNLEKGVADSWVYYLINPTELSFDQ